MTEIHIKKLTSEEIQELNVHAAQRLMLENNNTLIDLEGEIFDWTGKLGEARIELDRRKSKKSMIVEIQRALKAVSSNV